MRSKSCLCKNLATTSAPNVNDTPRSFSPQPIVSLSGSDHRRSHKSPWSGTSVGRMMRLICSMLWRSGLKPPWQQKIFSSTIAATGKQLKQSVKVFHSLMLYRRLPAQKKTNEHDVAKINFLYSIWFNYIRHKTHISYWWMRIRDFLSAGKSSRGTWFCMQVRDKSSPATVFLCRHSRLKRGNCSLVEILRTRTTARGRNIDRECHLRKKSRFVSNVAICKQVVPCLVRLRKNWKWRVLLVITRRTYRIFWVELRVPTK